MARGLEVDEILELELLAGLDRVLLGGVARHARRPRRRGIACARFFLTWSCVMTQCESAEKNLGVPPEARVRRHVRSPSCFGRGPRGSRREFRPDRGAGVRHEMAMPAVLEDPCGLLGALRQLVGELRGAVQIVIADQDVDGDVDRLGGGRVAAGDHREQTADGEQIGRSALEQRFREGWSGADTEGGAAIALVLIRPRGIGRAEGAPYDLAELATGADGIVAHRRADLRSGSGAGPSC